MNVAVLVPRRPDFARRDQSWAWIKRRWETEQPDWPIYEGHHESGLFNRSAAVNQAARDAGDFDIAIIADSDSFVGKPQIEAAVALCARTGKMTLAFDHWCALTRPMSDKIMGGFVGDWSPGVLADLEGSCSSMVVVTRQVWDEAEGFDEGFAGWGAEDIAFSHKAQTFGDGLQRVPGVVWHLWHGPQPRPTQHVNNARADLYHAAAYDRPKMRALIEQLRDVHV